MTRPQVKGVKNLRAVICLARSAAVMGYEDDFEQVEFEIAVARVVLVADPMEVQCGYHVVQEASGGRA